MAWLVPAALANLVGMLLSLAAYGYLYSVHRERFMGVWAASWALSVTRTAALLVDLHWGPSHFLLFLTQAAAFGSGILLLAGTLVFLRRPLGWPWAGLAAAGFGWTAVGAVAEVPFSLYTGPTFIFLAFANLWTGVVILRYLPGRRRGGALAGWAFVLWGLHKIDYPVLRGVAGFAPWGYLLAAGLGLAASLGMLLAYFEETRARLTESEGRFRLFAENARDLIYRYRLGPDRGFDYVSPSVAGITGFEAEKLYADRNLAYRRVHPEDRCRLRAALRGQGMDSDRMMVRIRHRDGSWRWTEQHLRLSPGEGGEPACVEGIARDATERVRAEEALRISENRLRELYEEAKRREQLYESLLHSTPDAVAVYDLEGAVEYVNPAFSRTFGYSLEELKGRRTPFVPEAEREATGAEIRKVLAGQPVEGFETRRMTKDGQVLEISLSSSCYYDHQGSPAGIVVILRDVTHSRETERQLRQAQKMEAVGTLAGGIAHDFHNLLQIILGYGDLLLLDRPEGDPDHREVQEIVKAAERATELTGQLLTFSRRVESRLRPVDLSREIEALETLLVHTLPRMIQVKVCPGRDLDLVNADPGQIEQVLLNLALNARDAMPEGGEILIETTRVTSPGAADEGLPDLPAGTYVRLRVADTGRGMQPEIVRHAFEPFFTTKGVGEGSGLGLSMVYGIVRAHGGHVACRSEPGKGTTFDLYLPRVAATVTAGEAEPAIREDANATEDETVLLVDDEEAILEVAKAALESHGYRVLTARSGEEALEVHRASPGRGDIALTILDLGMPGMGGEKCLKALLRTDPEASILVASGYSGNGQGEACRALGAAGFLPKPYRVADLVLQIRATLDRRTSGSHQA